MNWVYMERRRLVNKTKRKGGDYLLTIPPHVEQYGFTVIWQYGYPLDLKVTFAIDEQSLFSLILFTPLFDW